ncbi:hypothetical protein [Adhaeribacter aquaticus]|uniref:hypothetical protein n=1 Tax=Adhaeribacter aquaticus TaxID=299567 RepID=UPI0012F91688|nr:hypothetical protein [Adhaeribacter aquaticus]
MEKQQLINPAEIEQLNIHNCLELLRKLQDKAEASYNLPTRKALLKKVEARILKLVAVKESGGDITGV